MVEALGRGGRNNGPATELNGLSTDLKPDF